MEDLVEEDWRGAVVLDGVMFEESSSETDGDMLRVMLRVLRAVGLVGGGNSRGWLRVETIMTVAGGRSYLYMCIFLFLFLNCVYTYIAGSSASRKYRSRLASCCGGSVYGISSSNGRTSEGLRHGWYGVVVVQL